jgi:hypothetical protein
MGWPQPKFGDTMLSLLLLNPANALDCEEYSTHWPYFDHTELPLNTKLLINAVDTDSIVVGLRKQGEVEAVEGTWVEIQSEAYHFESSSPLEAETSYEVFDIGEGTYVRSNFTTADSLDEEAPAVPVLESLNRDTGEDEWGPWDYHSIIFETEDAMYYKMEFADNADFDNAKTVWEIPYNNVISVGNGPCSNDLTTEEIDTLVHIRATAYDAAGNASEPLSFLYEQEEETENEQEEEEENQEVPNDSEKTGGCSSVTGTAGLWGILGFIGLIRRRRS